MSCCVKITQRWLRWLGTIAQFVANTVNAGSIANTVNGGRGQSNQYVSLTGQHSAKFTHRVNGGGATLSMFECKMSLCIKLVHTVNS